MRRQVARVKVDDIGQHGETAFLHVEGGHFADGAGLAEGVEQVFAVETVVEPDAGGGGDHLVHGVDHVLPGRVLHRDADDRLGEVILEGKGGGHKGDDAFKAKRQVVAQGGTDLGIVFDEDQRHGALGQMGRAIT